VLFVVDVSGSMGTQDKIQQALNAMLAILEEMKQQISSQSGSTF
jgi:Mg-chelatase subunit ChlD